MARSLLRAAQLRDEDVMEEAEHDAWVHVNLVTSGTLNFQDGTISGTGDIYATTLYGDGSNLSGVGGGNPESLYYNTTDVRATASSDGINVTDGTYTADMHFDSGSNRFYIENKSGVEVRLTGESSGTRLLFVGQANGAASMYYAGSIKFQTVSDGVLVYNGSGDNLRLTGSGDDAIVRSITNDNNIVLQATDAAAEVKDVFRGDPDGSAELYYAGSKVMETISDGIKINDLAEPSRVTEIKQNDAITQIISRQHNGGIQIRLEDSNGTERPLFYGYANGTNPRVAIYAGSGVNVATFTDDGSEGGINIIRGSAPGTSGATVSMNTNNKIFYLRNNYDGGNVYIQGDSDNDTQVNMMALDPHGSWTFSSRNSVDTATNTLAIFDPDGAAELYYAGVKKFETTADGVTITDGRIEGNLLVAGNLTVSGTTFTTQTETVQISDNLLVINHGEVSTGVTEGEAGIEVDRGQAVNYRFMFDETDDYFVVGISGSEQPVATREDTPTQGYVPYWDASNYQFVNTDSPIKRTTNSGVELYCAGNKVFSTLYESSGGVGNNMGFYIGTHDGTAECMLVISPDDNWSFLRSNNMVFYLDAFTYPRTDPNDMYLRTSGVGGAVQTHIKLTGSGGMTGIYHNGSMVMETLANGIGVKTDNTGAAVTGVALYWNTGTYFGLYGYEHGTVFRIQGENAAGAAKDFLQGDPAGAVNLYYDGVKSLATRSGGIELHDATGTYYGTVNHNGTTLVMRNFGESQPISIGTTTATTLAFCKNIGLVADGQVELYYNNVKAFATKLDGIEIYSNTAGTVYDIVHKNSAAFAATNYIGEAWQLSTSTTALQNAAYKFVRWSDVTHATKTSQIVWQGSYLGTNHNIMQYVAGTMQLFQNNGVRLKTMSTGIDVGDGTNFMRLSHDGWGKLTSLVNSAPIHIEGLNAAGAGKTCILANPDAGTGLYWQGALKFVTTTAGATLAGVLTADGLTVGSGENIYLHTGGIVHDGINLRMTTTDGKIQLRYYNAGFFEMLQATPGGAVDLYYNNVLKAATLDDGFTIAGCLTLDEITTPTADADHGKVYTKTDNKLYFQDGAGAEHQIAFV